MERKGREESRARQEQQKTFDLMIQRAIDEEREREREAESVWSNCENDMHFFF